MEYWAVQGFLSYQCCERIFHVLLISNHTFAIFQFDSILTTVDLFIPFLTRSVLRWRSREYVIPCSSQWLWVSYIYKVWLNSFSNLSTCTSSFNSMGQAQRKNSDPGSISRCLVHGFRAAKARYKEHQTCIVCTSFFLNRAFFLRPCPINSNYLWCEPCLRG